MRASRLLSILIMLQMRGRLSADALAREFEVSTRTIHRDIDQLSAAGIPVFAERGRSGGFALMDGYRTKLTGFTAGEAQALIFSGLGNAAAELGLGNQAASAHLKLLASLPADKGATAERVASRFHFDAQNWYRPSETLAWLPALADAVWAERKMTITYESWQHRTTRTLAPLGLVLKAGTWYLVASHNKQPRTYRVSNILALTIHEETFLRPRKFDLAEYWNKWAKDFERRIMTQNARVRLSTEGLRLLKDLSPTAHHAAANEHVTIKPEGWIETTIPVEKNESAALQLLRLGPEIEILEPLSLRQAILHAARAIVARHQTPKSAARI